jgi:hypothetical protein
MSTELSESEPVISTPDAEVSLLNSATEMFALHHHNCHSRFHVPSPQHNMRITSVICVYIISTMTNKDKKRRNYFLDIVHHPNFS